MNISFHVGDILKSGCDTIVNSANPSLLAGGGLSGVIHKAAGPEMEEYLKPIGPIEAGNAVSSPAYNIEANHVIHTVATRCIHNDDNEFSTLINAYAEAINEAERLEVSTVALPAIGIGIYKWHHSRSAQAFFKAIERVSYTNQIKHLKEIKFYFLDSSLTDIFVRERDAWLKDLSDNK